MVKRKNHTLRFSGNALLFLFICVFLDQFTGRVLRHYYFTTTSGLNYQTTYSMDSTNAEVLIMGSSRAKHHYIPSLIWTRLHTTCYNTGRDGNFLLYNYALLKTIVKRYKPGIIILDINPEEMFYGQWSYDGLSVLLPYCKKNWDEIHDVIEMKGSFEKLKLQSAVYPFNSCLLSIVSDHFINLSKDTLNGYVPYYGHEKEMKFKDEENKLIEPTIDSCKIIALNNFTSICCRSGIKLYIVRSPKYSDEDVTKPQELITSIAMKNHAEFLNFGNSPEFIRNTSLFKDRVHLNDEGAKVLTNLIIDKIQQDTNTGK